MGIGLTSAEYLHTVVGTSLGTKLQVRVSPIGHLLHSSTLDRPMYPYCFPVHAMSLGLFLVWSS